MGSEEGGGAVLPLQTKKEEGGTKLRKYAALSEINFRLFLNMSKYAIKSYCIFTEIHAILVQNSLYF